MQTGTTYLQIIKLYGYKDDFKMYLFTGYCSSEKEISIPSNMLSNDSEYSQFWIQLVDAFKNLLFQGNIKIKAWFSKVELLDYRCQSNLYSTQLTDGKLFR